ncbi:hypothetical protein ACFV16_35695 [Streptomyces massasporeus]|uniref:hypothetical protein n=1 Tax=Streptomyces massasporeus TaxID=67324 RepID=UPI0036A893FF
MAPLTAPRPRTAGFVSALLPAVSLGFVLLTGVSDGMPPSPYASATTIATYYTEHRGPLLALSCSYALSAALFLWYGAFLSITTASTPTRAGTRALVIGMGASIIALMWAFNAAANMTAVTTAATDVPAAASVYRLAVLFTTTTGPLVALTLTAVTAAHGAPRPLSGYTACTALTALLHLVLPFAAVALRGLHLSLTLAAMGALGVWTAVTSLRTPDEIAHQSGATVEERIG